MAASCTRFRCLNLLLIKQTQVGKRMSHQDFGERMKVPDYTIYKVEDAPELVEVENALADKGLKDPWLRNEVWRHDVCEWGTHRSRLLAFFFRGFHYGLIAFVVTLIVEMAMGSSTRGEEEEKEEEEEDH